MMDLSHVFRRAFHICAPVWLLYYLLPENYLGIGREPLLIIGYSIAMLIEGFRLITGSVFIGIRGYERGQISALGWSATGLVVSLLFFPMIFVIPAVIGVGWVDPLIGELRRREGRGYPVLPFIVYFLIVLACLQTWSDIGPAQQLIIGAAASPVAIAVEKPSLKYIDDDFLMMVVPLEVMFLTGVLLNHLA